MGRSSREKSFYDYIYLKEQLEMLYEYKLNCSSQVSAEHEVFRVCIYLRIIM